MEKTLSNMSDLVPEVNRILQADLDCAPYLPMKMGEED